jgi:hypothetical protein
MEYIGNLIGTHLELEGNILGTKGKFKKSFPPNPKLQRKKIKAF